MKWALGTLAIGVFFIIDGSLRLRLLGDFWWVLIFPAFGFLFLEASSVKKTNGIGEKQE